MKLGKISESVLKRSVIKEIKYKRKEVVRGSSLGGDGAIIKTGGKDIITAVATYTGPMEQGGKRALHGAVNSLVASMGEPIGVMLSVLMPPHMMESDLREFMAFMNDQCKSMDIQIMGGHTETSDKITESVITVSVIGSSLKGEWSRPIATDSMAVLMTGYIGLEGTMVLLENKKDELEKRFSPSYIGRGEEFSQNISIKEEGVFAVKNGAIYMHDVSKTGVLGALWELGESLRMGMEINLKSLPIKQETIEFCEFFNINPYSLYGSGGLLMVAPEGEKLVQAFNDNGMECSIIGYLTEKKDKLIINGDEKRFIEPPKAGNNIIL